MEDKLELFLMIHSGDLFYRIIGLEYPNDLIKSIVKEPFSDVKVLTNDDMEDFLIEDFELESNHIYLFQVKMCCMPDENYPLPNSSIVVIVGVEKSTILVINEDYKYRIVHTSNELANHYINQFINGHEKICDFMIENMDCLIKDNSISVQECYFDRELVLEDLREVIDKIPEEFKHIAEDYEMLINS